MRRRPALIAASLLTTLVLASPGPAAAAPAPDCFDTDFAQACFSSFHDVFVDDVLCDFPVDVDVVGSIRYRPYFARGGSGDLASEMSHTASTRRSSIPRRADPSSTGAASPTGRPSFQMAPSKSATLLPASSARARQWNNSQRLLLQCRDHSMLVDATIRWSR